MSELFLTVLNMSLTASYVILFVILIRLLLKKAPKILSYVLWAVVAFRLIIPFSFESMYSLMPRDMNMAPISNDIIYQEAPQINSGLEIVDGFVNKSLPVASIESSANPLQIYVEIGAYIWVLGIISLLIYSLVSVLILKRQLKGAEVIEGNVYEAKNLQTPFVLGLIRPKIYLPIGLNVEERSYILLHEQTHIHRKDHIVKIFAFFTLVIHWFNPLVWIAFILMSRDMELSCDERVLQEINEDIKKPYANSLLSLATGKHILNGSPLAFGEGNVKGRIKNVLNFKKPATWVIVVSVAIITVVGVGLTTNRTTDVTGDYDFYNFYVNGFMLGADIDEMDTSTLTPTERLNVKDGYDFNFEEVRYSADEQTGRLRKMSVNVYDNGVMSMLVAHANGKDNVSLDSNETYQIEGIEAVLGKGKTGWHDREQRLRYMEYRHIEGRLSETVRFVYTDGQSEGINHRLVWVIAESNLPYSDSRDSVVENSGNEVESNEAGNDETNYDKISAYLKENSINVFSPYYELLGFEISDYQEEVVNGNVEATFLYTVKHKNYDRDPDTVGYIKEAKERGDSNYQQLYDEYLQAKDMNFYFKAIITNNDFIALYTKNPAIESDWERVEMSDFILGNE